jgi:hypothetical protein
MLSEHDPEKWKPVFPRDKRGTFARRSCSNKRITPEHYSTQLNNALAEGSAERGTVSAGEQGIKAISGRIAFQMTMMGTIANA